MSAEGFYIKCGGRGKDWRKAIVVEGAPLPPTILPTTLLTTTL
jgi:hypothetical protein